MKNDGTYFDYIIYTAFQTLLLHSNKKELSLKKIHEYRLYIIKQMEKYFSQYDSYDDEEFEERLFAFFEKNKNMSDQEESYKIKEFIENNNDLFYINENKICLVEDITSEEISEKKFKLECYNDSNDKLICGYILHYDDDINALNILGALDIVNDAQKLYEIEKKIESSYRNISDINSKNAIKFCNYLMYTRLLNIYKNDHYYINGYYRYIIENSSNDKNSVNINLLSDELKETDKFYKNNNYVDGYLEEMFYQAIFANNSLVYEKLLLYLKTLEIYKRPDFDGPLYEPVNGDWDSFLARFQSDDEFYEDEFEDNEYVDFLDENLNEEEDDIKELNTEYHTNYVFFLNYINNLIMYQKKYNREGLFNNEINRLSYLLNRFNKPLYYDELEELIDSVTLEDIDYRNDMYDFYVTARLFIFDLLINEIIDEHSLKKILYVITYYELTNDRRIKKIVNKHKKRKIGANIYDSVINHKNINFFEIKYTDEKDNGISFTKK